MNYKNSKAPLSTITYNREDIESSTQNLYEAIVVMANRANQINGDLKRELVDKLE
jgi:hypothetical protein